MHAAPPLNWVHSRIERFTIEMKETFSTLHDCKTRNEHRNLCFLLLMIMLFCETTRRVVGELTELKVS